MSDLAKESKLLQQVNTSGVFSKFSAYIRISGPGIWLTLASLSAGSLVGSLGIGQRLGAEGLWIQTWAMILGLFLLWAVSQITLNTQQSLFSLLKHEWNPSLGWWLAGSAMITNFAWCMPQFRLGADITGSILLPFLDNKLGKVAIAFAFLALSIFLSFWYERSGFRSKLLQWVLRVILFSLCLCLLISVFLALPNSNLKIGSILSGFLPNFSHLYQLPESYSPLLEETGQFRSFWESELFTRQRDLTLITFSSTLGINLLFALPLLLLGRGWKRSHTGLANFNLGTGLLLPFILCSSCIIILATISQQNYLNDLDGEGNNLSTISSSEKFAHTHSILTQRVIEEIGQQKFDELPPFQQEAHIENLSPTEHLLAHQVHQSGIKQWITSLSNGERPLVKYLLGYSVLLISFSTIVVLMVLNGHLVCEVLGKPHKGAPFQSGSLILAIASIGPFVWSDQDNWVADPSYFLSLAILPYALLSFILMLNSKDLLGRQCPSGLSGYILNLGAVLGFLTLGASSFYIVWNHNWGNFPVGQFLIVILGVLILCGYFSLKNKKLSNRLAGLETKIEKLQ